MFSTLLVSSSSLFLAVFCCHHTPSQHLFKPPLHLSCLSSLQGSSAACGRVTSVTLCEVIVQTAQDRVMWLNPSAWPSAVHWYIRKSEHLGYCIIDLLANLGDRKWHRFCVCLWVCVCMGGVRLENMVSKSRVLRHTKELKGRICKAILHSTLLQRVFSSFSMGQRRRDRGGRTEAALKATLVAVLVLKNPDSLCMWKD